MSTADNKVDKEAYVKLIRFLKAHGLGKEKKTLARLFDMFDDKAPHQPEVPHDPILFKELVEALKRNNTFSQPMESLRLMSTRKEANKKRKLAEYEPSNDLCQLEVFMERTEFRGIIGNFLSPQDLASLSCATKFLGGVVNEFIAGITEYSCTSRRSVKKEFVCEDFSVYVWAPCKEDIFEAWMLQKTRNLRKLTMVSCFYTILLKYCIRNLSKLEFLDVSYSLICDGVAKKLVENCKNLTVIRCFDRDDRYHLTGIFLHSKVLVNFGAHSLPFPNPNPVGPTVRTLELKHGNSLAESFKKLPPTLEQVEAWGCRILWLCTQLAKTNLSLKRLILHDNSYYSSFSDGDIAMFKDCRLEFQEMLKRTNMSISIGVKKKDVEMLNSLMSYVNIFEE
jgi:hypothetical protein